MPETNPSHRLALSSRRNFLSSASLALSGVVMGSPTAHGFLLREAPALDLDGLPARWVRNQGERTIQSYGRFLVGLELKHVTPLQVIRAHAKSKGSLWNSLPPKTMWKSMSGTLRVADRIASELDEPVKEITSAYRSPSYNRRCPGAKSRSWHMQNYALDVKFKTPAWKVAKAARYLRSKGVFKGGIGRYNTFTHIDTRGHNADW